MTDFSTLLYISSSEIPTLSYALGLKKDNPFGQNLPVQAIIGMKQLYNNILERLSYDLEKWFR